MGTQHMPRRAHVWQRSAGIAVVAGVAAGSLALSPMLLLGLDSAYDVNWTLLSEIGQSYTAAATLLSTVALLGVAYSLRLQAKQTALSQGQAIRQFQFELLRLGMSDPLYAAVLSTDAGVGETHDNFRQHVYITQWFRYLQFSYLSAEMTETTLEHALERGLFSIPANRAWWINARKAWISEAEGGRDPKVDRFIATVDRAFVSATPPVNPTPADNVPRGL